MKANGPKLTLLGRPAHAYAPRGAAIFFPARGSDGRDALFITAVRKRSRPSRSTRSPGLQSNRTPACDRPCRWRRSSCGADAARPGFLRAFGPRSWACLGGGKRRTPPEWATRTGRARQKPESDPGRLCSGGIHRHVGARDRAIFLGNTFRFWAPRTHYYGLAAEPRRWPRVAEAGTGAPGRDRKEGAVRQAIAADEGGRHAARWRRRTARGAASLWNRGCRFGALGARVGRPRAQPRRHQHHVIAVLKTTKDHKRGTVRDGPRPGRAGGVGIANF